MRRALVGLFTGSLFSAGAMAASAAVPGTRHLPFNPSAIAMFLVFVLCTLGVTYWASARIKSMADFYTAGSRVSGLQNGLAIAGDYMSAATLLGLTSLVYAKGFDGLIYTVSFFIGWPIILFLLAERLRNLGNFTLADIATSRLDQDRLRIFAAFGSLTVVCFYLIVQMVGAGQVIELLFGLEYTYAVIAVGVLMMVYVTFGGMVATTWVQIIKACLLLGGGSLLVVLAFARFGFSFEALFAKAVAVHPSGSAIMAPGTLMADPVSAVSLSLALLFGTAGLPHIMMRFFTVPNVQEARKSVFYATGFIGFFFLVVVLLGVLAIAIVAGDPRFFVGGVVGRELIGGSNMPVMHLAKSVGGDVFLGFLSAVAFATILAVVSGLALAGASAIAHDLYARVLKQNKASAAQEMKVGKIASVGIGVVAILLGLLFRDQNIAFLVALTFGVAASVNFPILILSLYWSRLTTRGALWGGIAGLVSALGLVILSPAVWVRVLGHAEAIFPYEHPAIISMSLAFAVTWLLSVTDRSVRATHEIAAFEAHYIRAQTGLGTTAREF